LNPVIAISANVLSEQSDAGAVLVAAPHILGPRSTAPDGLDLDLHELDPVEERDLAVIDLADRAAANTAAFDDYTPSHYSNSPVDRNGPQRIAEVPYPHDSPERGLAVPQLAHSANILPMIHAVPEQPGQWFTSPSRY
jgi:hypothetical protein